MRNKIDHVHYCSTILGEAKCDSEMILPDPHNCSQFFQCINGEIKLGVCPHGLYFNQNRLLCDVEGKSSFVYAFLSHSLTKDPFHKV